MNKIGNGADRGLESDDLEIERKKQIPQERHEPTKTKSQNKTVDKSDETSAPSHAVADDVLTEES